MRKQAAVMIALLVGAGLSFGAASRAGSHHGAKESVHPSSRDRHASVVQTFATMYGVDGPFVGEQNAIRGVPGDELPWEVEAAEGSLDTQGHLRIKVRGLVFKDDPSVPEELRGKNDETEFRGLVSCLTETDAEEIATVNVMTEGFHATPSGNSNIRATVSLPNPCIAPILMVLAGSEDKWFAVAGFELE